MGSNRIYYIRIEERDNAGRVMRRIERLGTIDTKKPTSPQLETWAKQAGKVFGLAIDRTPILKRLPKPD